MSTVLKVPTRRAYPLLTVENLPGLISKGDVEGQFSQPFMIDATVAQFILDNFNAHNRPMSRVNLLRLVEEITKGRWMLLQEGISFSGSRLNNGQHRLRAVIEAGACVPFNVTFGEDENAFKVKDTGKPRSKGDVIHIQFGDADGNLTAAMARVLITVERFYAGHENEPRGKKTYDTDVLLNMRSQMEDQRETLLEAVQEGRRQRRAFSGISTGGAAAAYWLIVTATRYNKTKVDEFFEHLREGTNLLAGDARFILRKSLLEHSRKTALRQPSGLFSNCKHSQPVETAALMILAWNAFVDGRPRKNTITWPASGEHPQPFPKVR